MQPHEQRDIKIMKNAVRNIIDQSMHRDILASGPGVLDRRSLTNIDDLFDDVQLTEFVEAGTLAERRKYVLVKTRRVLDVPQPVIDQAVSGIFHRGLHSAATVVSGDHNMTDVQHLYGELNHRQAIHI